MVDEYLQALFLLSLLFLPALKSDFSDNHTLTLEKAHLKSFYDLPLDMTNINLLFPTWFMIHQRNRMRISLLRVNNDRRGRVSSFIVSNVWYLFEKRFFVIANQCRDTQSLMINEDHSRDVAGIFVVRLPLHFCLQCVSKFSPHTLPSLYFLPWFDGVRHLTICIADVVKASEAYS